MASREETGDHDPGDASGQATGPPRQPGPLRRASASQTPRADGPLEISSDALLGGRTELHIRHRGEIYRLTVTRAGKLILHK